MNEQGNDAAKPALPVPRISEAEILQLAEEAHKQYEEYMRIMEKVDIVEASKQKPQTSKWDVNFEILEKNTRDAKSS